MKICYYFIIVTALLCSCTSQRYIYNPSPFYNPQFKDKGQIDISAKYTSGPSEGLSTGAWENKDKNNGYNLNAGYSISKHFSLTAGYYSVNEKDIYAPLYNYNRDIDSTVVLYSRNLKQLGIGYIVPIKNSKNSISLFATFGSGHNNIDEIGLKNGSTHSNFHYSDSYVFSFQPALNIELQSNFHLSVISRFTYVNNNDVRSDYTDNQRESAGLTNIIDLYYGAIGYNLLFWFKKLPWLRIEQQSFISSRGRSALDLHFARTSNNSLGISLAIDQLLKKNK